MISAVCGQQLARPHLQTCPLLLHVWARACVQGYTVACIRQFAHQFAARLNPQLTPEQVDMLSNDVLSQMSAMQDPMMMPQANLRLVLRHDCL